MSIADILKNATAHETRMLQASRDVLEDWAEETAGWEQQNRPWTDRTGHARLGLTLVRDHPDDLRDGGRVHLVHGVSYGRYLETSHGSRFAIIGPAVATKGQELVQDLREVWSQ
jgi:hypothetical protein